MFLRIVATGLITLLMNGCGQQSTEHSTEHSTKHSTKKSPQYSAEVFNAKWMAGALLPDSGAFLLVGEQGSIARSDNGRDWLYAQTPVTHTLNNIASDSEGKVIIAVGDAGTVLRSLDGGRTWRMPAISLPEGSDFSSTQLKVVTYSPQANTWLAAGTQNAILRSSDNGENWQLVSYNTSETQLEILALFTETSTGDLLFAAQQGTMGRSRDGGMHWQITRHDMQPTGDYIPHIVGFHQHGGVLIAAADHGRLLVSENGGAKWRLLKLPTAGYFTASAYDPIHKAIVLTTQMGEIAHSIDNGQSWQLVTPAVNNWPGDDIPFLSSVVYDSKSRSLLAVGNSGVVVRSVDGGATWRGGALKALFNHSVTTLLHAPKKDLFILAGLGGFIANAHGLRAENPLAGWELTRPGIDEYMREILHVAGSNTFVVVGQLGSVWRSDDDGRSWDAVEVDYPHPNQPPHLRDVIAEPITGALVAAGPVGSIVRSTDNGVNWQPVFQGKVVKGEAFTQILVDKKRRALLACEVLYRSVYRSLDGGTTWTKSAVIDSAAGNLWHGAISQTHDLVMLVGQLGAIAVSHDGGGNWQLAQSPVKNDLYGAFADETSGVLVAVGQNGVIVRSDDGRDWQKVDSDTLHTLRRVVREPETGALLAFGQAGTIVRSTDSGVSWQRAETPVKNEELRKALLEPNTGNLLVLGQNGLILRSTDHGKSWHGVASHSRQHFRSAAFNPVTGTLIAVGDGLVRLQMQ